jgi:integrase
LTKRAAKGSGCVFQPTYTDKGILKTSSTWWFKLPDGTKGKCDGATSEREARNFLLKLLGQVHNGTAPAPKEKELTYGTLRELFLLDKQVKRNRSLRQLSDGGFYVSGLTALDQYFGWTRNNPSGDRVSSFNPTKWESNFILMRRQEGVSEATIAHSAKILRNMFKIAVEKKLMTAAPKVSVPKARDAKEHVLFKEQFDQLLDPTYGVAKDFVPLFTFLFYQGTRVGEALNLRRGQIDLKAAIYHPNPKFNKTADKNQKALHHIVVDVLGEPGNDDAYVFETTRAGGTNIARLAYDEFQDAMLRLKFGAYMWECAQCKDTQLGAKPDKDAPAIECEHCSNVPMTYKYVGPSVHSLRASCVVFYLESGMSETEVMKITGHNDISVFRGYARLSNDNLKRSMDAAEEMREKRRREFERANRRKGNA